LIWGPPIILFAILAGGGALLLLLDTMKSTLSGTSGIEKVRQFVQQTICEQNDLDVAAAPVNERTLLRQGKSCGVLFCVKGPRSVTFTAIWDQAKNTVVFYDSTGKSRLRTNLATIN